MEKLLGTFSFDLWDLNGSRVEPASGLIPSRMASWLSFSNVTGQWLCLRSFKEFLWEKCWFQEDFWFQCLNQHHICNKYGKSEGYRAWSNWKKRRGLLPLSRILWNHSVVFSSSSESKWRILESFCWFIELFWMLNRNSAFFFFFPSKKCMEFKLSDLTCGAGHWAIHSHCSSWPEVPKEQDKAQTEFCCRGFCIETSAHRNRSFHMGFSFQSEPQHLWHKCPDSSEANRFFPRLTRLFLTCKTGFRWKTKHSRKENEWRDDPFKAMKNFCVPMTPPAQQDKPMDPSWNEDLGEHPFSCQKAKGCTGRLFMAVRTWTPLGAALCHIPL